MSTQQEPPTHEDLILLITYMADQNYTAHDVVYAVEKPWKYVEVLAEAKLDKADVLEWNADRFETPEDAAVSRSAAADLRTEVQS